MEENTQNLQTPADPQEIVPVKDEKPAKPQANVVGIGAYFGLIPLFLIPVVGLIASIIFSFAAKNKSVKNFARAWMIWNLVGVLCVGLTIGAAVFAVRAALDAVSEYISDPENLAQYGVIGEILSEIPEEERKELIEQFKSGAFGDPKELIEKFFNGEFGDPNDLKDRYENGEFGDITDIIDQIGSTDISDAIGQLQTSDVP